MSDYAARLRDKQMEFAAMVPKLIVRARELGYRVTLGDAFRDPRAPYGSASSKHRRRLAIDLNLFREIDGEWQYCTESADHLELGEWWESVGGQWGGRFNDGNHYQWPDP